MSVIALLCVVCSIGTNTDERSKESFRQQLRDGLMEQQEIEVNIQPKSEGAKSNQASVEFQGTLADLFIKNGQVKTGKKAKELKKLTISDARYEISMYMIYAPLQFTATLCLRIYAYVLL